MLRRIAFPKPGFRLGDDAVHIQRFGRAAQPFLYLAAPPGWFGLLELRLTMTLDEVKPWGRSLGEYTRMFNLSEADLRAGILGCGDGPASFNAEMTGLGCRVVSADPIYAFSEAEIERRVQETYTPILSQAEENADRYVWTHFPTIEALGRARLEAMKTFLADFGTGLAESRYLPRALPSLGFADGQFALALCSHLLFLYSEQLH